MLTLRIKPVKFGKVRKKFQVDKVRSFNLLYIKARNSNRYRRFKKNNKIADKDEDNLSKQYPNRAGDLQDAVLILGDSYVAKQTNPPKSSSIHPIEKLFNKVNIIGSLPVINVAVGGSRLHNLTAQIK